MIRVRPIERRDHDAWLPMWLGYNAFYGREGDTALDPAITESTWGRLFDEAEPVWAYVAEDDAENGAGELLGFVHIIYHRNTIFLQPVCYLQDLFTTLEARGRGVGGALIQAVYDRAAADDVTRVYWNTKQDNVVAQRLYDKLATKTDFLLYRHDA